MLNKFYKLVVVSAAFIPISIYATENQIDSVSQQRNIPQLTEIVGSSLAKKLCNYQTDEGLKTTDRLKKMLFFFNHGGAKVLQSANLELPTPQWDKIQKCLEEFHINDTYMVRNATGNLSVFLTHVLYEMLTTVKKEDTAGFLSLENLFPYFSPALVTYYLTPQMTW